MSVLCCGLNLTNWLLDVVIFLQIVLQLFHHLVIPKEIAHYKSGGSSNLALWITLICTRIIVPFLTGSLKSDSSAMRPVHGIHASEQLPMHSEWFGTMFNEPQWQCSMSIYGHMTRPQPSSIGRKARIAHNAVHCHRSVPSGHMTLVYVFLSLTNIVFLEWRDMECYNQKCNSYYCRHQGWLARYWCV